MKQIALEDYNFMLSKLNTQTHEEHPFITGLRSYLTQHKNSKIVFSLKILQEFIEEFLSKSMLSNNEENYVNLVRLLFGNNNGGYHDYFSTIKNIKVDPVARFLTAARLRFLPSECSLMRVLDTMGIWIVAPYLDIMPFFRTAKKQTFKLFESFFHRGLDEFSIVSEMKKITSFVSVLDLQDDLSIQEKIKEIFKNFELFNVGTILWALEYAVQTTRLVYLPITKKSKCLELIIDGCWNNYTFFIALKTLNNLASNLMNNDDDLFWHYIDALNNLHYSCYHKADSLTGNLLEDLHVDNPCFLPSLVASSFKFSSESCTPDEYEDFGLNIGIYDALIKLKRPDCSSQDVENVFAVLIQDKTILNNPKLLTLTLQKHPEKYVRCLLVNVLLNELKINRTNNGTQKLFHSLHPEIKMAEQVEPLLDILPPNFDELVYFELFLDDKSLQSFLCESMQIRPELRDFFNSTDISFILDDFIQFYTTTRSFLSHEKQSVLLNQLIGINHNTISVTRFLMILRRLDDISLESSLSEDCKNNDDEEFDQIIGDIINNLSYILSKMHEAKIADQFECYCNHLLFQAEEKLNKDQLIKKINDDYLKIHCGKLFDMVMDILLTDLINSTPEFEKKHEDIVYNIFSSGIFSNSADFSKLKSLFQALHNYIKNNSCLLPDELIDGFKRIIGESASFDGTINIPSKRQKTEGGTNGFFLSTNSPSKNMENEFELVTELLYKPCI